MWLLRLNQRCLPRSAATSASISLSISDQKGLLRRRVSEPRVIVTAPSPYDYYEQLLPFTKLDEEEIADDEELAAK